MADHDEDGDNGESKYHSRLMGKTEMDVVQYQTSASLLCQIGNHLIGLESDSKTYSNCGYDLCDAAVMSVLPIALHMMLVLRKLKRVSMSTLVTSGFLQLQYPIRACGVALMRLRHFSNKF